MFGSALSSASGSLFPEAQKHTLKPSVHRTVIPFDQSTGQGTTWGKATPGALLSLSLNGVIYLSHVSVTFVSSKPEASGLPPGQSLACGCLHTQGLMGGRKPLEGFDSSAANDRASHLSD